MGYTYAEQSFLNFVEENPSFMYIRNINPNMDGISSVCKNFLLKEEVKEWEQLPPILSWKEIKAINAHYKNNLRWQLIKSGITDGDIKKAEIEMGLSIPIEYKQFLKSYLTLRRLFIGHLRGDYTGTYNMETGQYSEQIDDTAIIPFQIYETPLYNNLGKIDFNALTDMLLARCEHIYLGTFGPCGYLFLDCRTGQIVIIDEESYAIVANTWEDVKKDSDILFHTFNDFLRCIHKQDIYDPYEQRFL